MLASLQTVTGTINLAKAGKQPRTQDGETFWFARIGSGGIAEKVIAGLAAKGFYFVLNNDGTENLVWSKGR